MASRKKSISMSKKFFLVLSEWNKVFLHGTHEDLHISRRRKFSFFNVFNYFLPFQKIQFRTEGKTILSNLVLEILTTVQQ